MFDFSGIRKLQGKSFYILAEIVDVFETGLNLKFGSEQMDLFRFESISEIRIVPMMMRWKISKILTAAKVMNIF